MNTLVGTVTDISPRRLRLSLIRGGGPIGTPLVVVEMSVEDPYRSYFGVSSRQEFWGSRWDEIAAPQDIQVGTRVRIGLNPIGIPMDIRKEALSETNTIDPRVL